MGGTQAGVGISHHRNPNIAGQEAAQQAMQAAGITQKPDFTFVFASVGYNQSALIGAVRQTTGGVPLCGCSGEGVIAHHEADESNFSVAVMAICSNELHFHHGVATGLKSDSATVGHAIAHDIVALNLSDAKGLFLFADSLTCNYDRLTTALEQEMNLQHHLPFLGGLAGDNWQGNQTYQYYNDTVVSDGVSWALLTGDVSLISAVNHGCVTLGLERTITRCEGNTIYEIDGKPALDVLREYIDEQDVESWALTLASLCIGFQAPSYMQQGYDDYIIRFVPTKDDETGSVTIVTEVTEGTPIWLARRDYDKIAAGISTMTEQIAQQLGNHTPKLVLHFDCAGRGKMIFSKAQKQDILNTLQRPFGSDVPWMGFYTYGEIGPVANHNCFHNYTVVLAIIY